jgi:hypothetical protein
MTRNLCARERLLVAREYGVIIVEFTREGISSLVGAFAGNVTAMRDTNMMQLFKIIDCL